MKINRFSGIRLLNMTHFFCPGVILFANVSADAELTSLDESDLDKWYEGNTANGHTLDRCTLRQLRELIKSEENLWKKWADKHKEARGEPFNRVSLPRLSHSADRFVLPLLTPQPLELILLKIHQVSPQPLFSVLR